MIHDDNGTNIAHVKIYVLFGPKRLTSAHVSDYTKKDQINSKVD